jgi:hypothetical protein
MKKFGIVLSFMVIAALAFAVLQPKRLQLVRMRMYADGLAWAEVKCTTSNDCVAVVYRGKTSACQREFGWVTAKKNHGAENLEATGRIIFQLEQDLGAAPACGRGSLALTPKCENEICMASPQ